MTKNATMTIHAYGPRVARDALVVAMDALDEGGPIRGGPIETLLASAEPRPFGTPLIVQSHTAVMIDVEMRWDAIWPSLAEAIAEEYEGLVVSMIGRHGDDVVVIEQHGPDGQRFRQVLEGDVQVHGMIEGSTQPGAREAGSLAYEIESVIVPRLMGCRGLERDAVLEDGFLAMVAHDDGSVDVVQLDALGRGIAMNGIGAKDRKPSRHVVNMQDGYAEVQHAILGAARATET